MKFPEDGDFSASGDRFQKVVDGLVGLQRMAQTGSAIDGVVVAAADLANPHDASRGELGDDAVDPPFGDAHSVGDLANQGIGVLGQTHQDVSMIAEKCPAIVGPGHGANVAEAGVHVLNRRCRVDRSRQRGSCNRVGFRTEES